MSTVLIVLATLAAWHLARWGWAHRPQYDLDQWLCRWRPNLLTRQDAAALTIAEVREAEENAAYREAEMRRVAALEAEQAMEAADRRVAEALATIVDDPRTPEEAAELKAVFERVHQDERFKDLPPTQQTAAARRIQKLGMERLGHLDLAPAKPKSGRTAVPPTAQ